MADLYRHAGRWIRHWRLQRGLTLADLAGRVGCSTSQLSLIENGKREPRLSTLERLADALGISLEDLVSGGAPSERDELEVRLADLQELDAYRSLGLPAVRPTKAMPLEVLKALVGLHEELGRQESTAPATPEEARRANAELRARMRDLTNYFPELEREASALLAAVGHQSGPVGERRVHQIAEHLGFELVTVNDLPYSTRSIIDLEHRRIYLPTSGWGGHDPRTITLQSIGHHVLGHQTPHSYADFLRQRVEVNYFAAAILVNEDQASQMLLRAKAGRYLAIEDVRDAFAVSYETAAHRFTNLITHHCGIEVDFLKVHESGLIYKAYENDGFPLPMDPLGAIEGQPACREWPVRQALLEGVQPGNPYSQYIDTPAGTYWSIVQAEHTSAGEFAVSIGTRFADSQWFRGRDTAQRRTSTCPDGPCCRRAPASLRSRWEGNSWPSARAQAHLLSALPPGAFPGVDETDVYTFLERRSGEPSH